MGFELRFLCFPAKFFPHWTHLLSSPKACVLWWPTSACSASYELLSFPRGNQHTKRLNDLSKSQINWRWDSGSSLQLLVYWFSPGFQSTLERSQWVWMRPQDEFHPQLVLNDWAEFSISCTTEFLMGVVIVNTLAFSHWWGFTLLFCFCFCFVLWLGLM